MSWYGDQVRNLSVGKQSKILPYYPHTRAAELVTVTLIVPDMKNDNDCQIVTKAINSLPGVVDSTTIPNRRRLQVTYNASLTTVENISYHLCSIGYDIIRKA